MKALPAMLPFRFVLILAIIGGAEGPQRTVATSTDGRARIPVVLELFTSEGCSSCPPADDLLAKLEEQQPIAGAEVIALEEHVDYWDQQGWVDPFSSAQWTQRQQGYAAGFGNHSVYTPELVVNGRVSFVGSHAGDTYRAIASAVAEPRTEISVSPIKAEKRDHERVKVEVGKLQGAQEGDVVEVWLAITEMALHSAVRAGENSGHDLHHASVVRWLRKLGTTDRNAARSFAGESDMKIDSTWKRANLRAVAFVQEKRSHHILGAATMRLEP